MNLEDTYRITGLISPVELRFLKDILVTVPDNSKAVVNIGAYYGASGAALLLGMQKYNITGSLFCIDVFRYHNAGGPKMKPFRERTDVPWSNSFIEQTKRNLAPFQGDKDVQYVQCFSDDFDLSIVDGISLVFIDADHSVHGCLLDALKYSQKVIDGGLMLFHDYTIFASVKEAISIFAKLRPDFKMKGVCDSIAVVQKEAKERGSGFEAV